MYAIRSYYDDTYGHDGLKNSGYSGPGNFDDVFSSFGDIFSDLFGFGNARTQSRRNGPIPGNDLRYDLQISFMEAVRITSYNVCYTKLLRLFQELQRYLRYRNRAVHQGYSLMV